MLSKSGTLPLGANQARQLLTTTPLCYKKTKLDPCLTLPIGNFKCRSLTCLTILTTRLTSPTRWNSHSPPLHTIHSYKSYKLNHHDIVFFPYQVRTSRIRQKNPKILFRSPTPSLRQLTPPNPPQAVTWPMKFSTPLSRMVS